MTNKLDHVAIIVDSLEDGIAFYSGTAGLGPAIVKDVPELKIRCAFFDTGAAPIIELVEFAGQSDLTHGDIVLALEVDDLDASIAHFRAKGVRVFDQPPTPNLPLRRGWVLKKDGHGTVIELCPRGEVAQFVRKHGKTSTRAADN
jgi:methylmalonyl-CoA/ethylmalonyl-CoA epimerase